MDKPAITSMINLFLYQLKKPQHFHFKGKSKLKKHRLQK